MEQKTPYSPAFFEEVKQKLLGFGFKLVTSGKVRDVYEKDGYIAMITTDRISAFDVISEQPIPYKGQVLNCIAKYFLEDARAKSICPVWLKSTPNQNTMVGINCPPVKVEMVIRGFLCGSAWRKYQNGQREFWGITLPDKMAENDEFEKPIITPTTKADSGHDEDITKEEILAKGLVKPVEYALMEEYTRRLFARGSEIAKDHDLFLADTKYEFGISRNGAVTLIDEVNTPDSSRFFQMEGFYKRQRGNMPQIQLSKEFLREWLMEQGYNGQKEIAFPVMPPEIVAGVSFRYEELYHRFLGEKFVPETLSVSEFVESIIG